MPGQGRQVDGGGVVEQAYGGVGGGGGAGGGRGQHHRPDGDRGHRGDLDLVELGQRRAPGPEFTAQGRPVENRHVASKN
ncbi:MAG: hypothetical protein IPG94_14085 [Kineosporiaceae bacterium]|nr:hypothetical protein [Kineosporiaceae bacterium]